MASDLTVSHPALGHRLTSSVQQDTAPLPPPSPLSRLAIMALPHNPAGSPLAASLPSPLSIASGAKSFLTGSYHAAKEGEIDADEDKKLDKEQKKRTKNWSRPETLLLVRLRADLAPMFGRTGRNRELWDEISKALQKEHFLRDSLQCKYRWEKLVARYKAVRRGSKEKRDNPYYDELHVFFSGKASRRDREKENNFFRHENELDVGTKQAAADLRRDLSLDFPLRAAEKEVAFRSYPRKEGLGAGDAREKEKNLFELELGAQQAATDLRRALSLNGALKDGSKDGASRADLSKEGFGGGEEKDRENNSFRHQNELELRIQKAISDFKGELNLHSAVIDAQKEGLSRAHSSKEGPGAVEDEVIGLRTPPLKRKRGPKLVTLTDVHAVQTLLDTAISRQQRFFMDLLEAMERREQIRERRRQEREEEWRAEDRAQRSIFNNAMMVLTQKLVGERIVTTVPGLSESLVCSNVGHEAAKKRSKNWNRAEVLELIKLRREMENKFTMSIRRSAPWEELADLLAAQGIKRNGKECREKWEKMMSQYKEVLDGEREQADSHYFAELTAVVEGPTEET